MQAILTRFLPATNHRPARISATTEGGAYIVVSYDDQGIGVEAAHRAAAEALITRMGWYRDSEPGASYADWYCGSIKEGYAFVNAADFARVTLKAVKESL
jgi:hypothetical protein